MKHTDALANATRIIGGTIVLKARFTYTEPTLNLTNCTIALVVYQGVKLLTLTTANGGLVRSVNEAIEQEVTAEVPASFTAQLNTSLAHYFWQITATNGYVLKDARWGGRFQMVRQ